MYDCRWTEILLSLVIIVFSVLVVTSWSKWLVFVAAVILLLHAFMCNNCRVKKK